MIKKILATAAVTASIVGAGATLAPQAMAIGNQGGTTTAADNGSVQAFGNEVTHGDMSPQLSLVQGSLNKPCIGLPAKGNVGSLVGFVPVTVQDIPVLSSPQNQQCTENSTQAKGDDALSHVLSNIPVLSGNGSVDGS
ncbi:rodlin [Streptomyces sp. NPDC051322]|uniref:rodlin n=1 Tax=Streptomyces sp. NPDC051322 TaxID=3154645 RepID=UPI00344F1728